MKKIFSEEVDINEYKITSCILDIIPENEEDKKILNNWIEDYLHIEKFQTKEGVELILYSKCEEIDK